MRKENEFIIGKGKYFYIFQPFSTKKVKIYLTTVACVKIGINSYHEDVAFNLEEKVV